MTSAAAPTCLGTGETEENWHPPLNIEAFLERCLDKQMWAREGRDGERGETGNKLSTWENRLCKLRAPRLHKLNREAAKWRSGQGFLSGEGHSGKRR